MCIRCFVSGFQTILIYTFISNFYVDIIKCFVKKIILTQKELPFLNNNLNQKKFDVFNGYLVEKQIVSMLWLDAHI